MSKHDVKKTVVFELSKDGEDRIEIIASKEFVKSFLSHFPDLVNNKWDKPSMYYSASGTYDEQKNIFTFSTEFDQSEILSEDQLAIVTKIDEMINFFSCLVGHWETDEVEPRRLLEYRGNFIEQPEPKSQQGAV